MTMNNLWQATFSDVVGWLMPASTHDDPIEQAIDQLIDRSNPHLRALGNVQRVLRPPMQRAHDYVTSLVGEIPGPTDICTNSYTRDPLVNTFFATVDDLHQVFSASDALRTFFAAPEHAGCNNCLALLCMQLHEKKVFGIEMDGDVLRRDVPQTLVSFDDHQILAPAEKEEELRRGLHRCMLDGLMNHARERLSSGQQRQRQLRDEHRMLSSRLRVLERHEASHANSPDSTSSADTRRQLATIDAELAQLRHCCGDLGAQLRALAQALDQAHEQVRIEHRQLRLSPTLVKLDANSDSRSRLLSLSEVRLGNEPPRVVTLTRYPRDEVQERPRLIIG